VGQHPSADLRAALRAAAGRHGGRTALTVHDGDRWTTASWAELESAAGSAAARAHRDGTVILANDNRVGTLATLLGLLLAGVDLVVVESDAGQDAPAAATAGGPYVYQSTSGSTGAPRLARQTLANLLHGGAIYQQMYGIGPDDAIVAAMPTAHSFGMVAGLFAAVVSGAGLITFTRFNPRALGTAVEAGATILLGTPLVYEMVNRTISAARSRLRVALSSGGPVAPGVAGTASARLGAPVLQVYGSTETGVIAAQRPATEPWPEGCVGTAAPGVRLRVVGGHLRVHTETMFHGYLGQPAEPVGEYDTGDLATLDDSGRLYLHGRKDTFINVGGRKVNPVRVQRLLEGYPHVTESAVYGVEALGGQEVHAAVVLTGSGSVEELIGHCRGRLADFEVPHRVHVLPRLPRTGMGKVDRSRLPGTDRSADR
jgi:acyl-CoA synthetase (AMP-forming)/AMP-acid ligase II